MKENIKSSNYLYLVVLSGNFLALTGDSSISWPSGVLPKLSSNDSNINPLDRAISDDEMSWIGSINSIGSIVGMIPFSILVDVVGRKPCLLIIAIPHIVSYMTLAFAKNIILYYVARFLSGVAVSSCYVVLPMYVAEISENSNRGLMLVSYGIFASLGTLLSYLAGPYLSIFWFNIFLSIFPILFLILFSLFAPESPYFYVIKKDFQKAREVIYKLRSNDYKNAELELECMQKEVQDAKRGKILQTLVKKHALKGCLIAIILTTFQQLSGYAAYVPYTQTIFEQAGSKVPAEIASIIVGSVFFVTSFFCPFIVDRKGRRFLLILSLSGIIASHIVFGTYYYVQFHGTSVESFSWLPLVCLVTFMLMFSFGLGPLPLTITSEILPVNIKYFVSTVAGVFGSLGYFVVAKNFNYLNEVIGKSGTVWLFGGICVALLTFVWFFIPETKGKTFREIRESLDS